MKNLHLVALFLEIKKSSRNQLDKQNYNPASDGFKLQISSNAYCKDYLIRSDMRDFQFLNYFHSLQPQGRQ